MCNDNDNNNDVNDDYASYFIYYRFDAEKTAIKFTLLLLNITLLFSAIFSLSTKTFIAQLLIRSRHIHSNIFMVR